jgi:hypothetical protein
MERKPSLPACSTDHGQQSNLHRTNKPRIGRIKRSPCWKLHLNPSVSLFSVADAGNNHRLLLQRHVGAACYAQPPSNGRVPVANELGCLHLHHGGWRTGSVPWTWRMHGMGGQQNGRWRSCSPLHLHPPADSHSGWYRVRTWWYVGTGYELWSMPV